MTTLFLIRHGENDYLKQNRLPGRLPGIHLNERGREQASALARALEKLPVKAVYSSPLERAVETAEPIAASLHLKVRLRQGLREADVGEWEGQSFKKLVKKPAWELVERTPSLFRFPGGDSFLELETRIVNELETIRAAHHPRDIIVVVFHADPIKVAVAHYLGLPLDAFQKLFVSPGSATVFFLNVGWVRLVGLNLKPPFQFDLPKRKK
jgi:probable phosphomutase (TIGR03848 family)